MWKHLALVVVLFVLALSGCGNTERPSAEGEAQVVASLGAALSAAEVTRVTITVTGSGISSPLVTTLTKAGNAWQGVVGRIPVGADRLFHGDAVDTAGKVLYAGEAHAAITAGTTAAISMTLQQLDASPPFANAAPVIDAIVLSSATVAPGAPVSVAVTAHDPNGDALTYGWSASGGAFAAPSAPTTIWTAPPTEGSRILTILVADPGGASVTASVTVEVATAPAAGSASVRVSVNTWPVVRSVLAKPARIDAGQTTTLSLVADDSDGDPLSYQWSATCAGSFDDAAAQAPHFTLGTSTASGSCTFTTLVKDGRDGTATGSFTISTGGPASAIIAPQVDSASQSQATADGGQTLAFAVGAHDPQGLALTFIWSASSGTFATQVDGAGESSVQWTAATCAGTPVTPIVRVTIRSSALASSVQTFAVTSTCTIVASSCSDGIKNGSETDVDCGGPTCQSCALGRACAAASDCAAPPNAAAACMGGTCALGACNAGYYDCDTSAASGCETPSSTSNCNACGNVCSSGQVCQSASCVSPAWSRVAGVVGTPVSIGIGPNSGATPYVIYVATSGNGIYHSTDGVTWASSGPASVTAVAGMPQPNASFASLADGSVQNTQTSGASWAATASSPGAVVRNWIGIAGVGPMGIASNATGSAIVYQGKSSGAQWIPSSPFGTGDGTGIAVGGGTSPNITVYASVSGAAGGVFKSVNVGSAGYSFAATPFPVAQALSVATAPSALGTVFAGTNGQGAGVYVSVDAGATWAPAGTGLGNTVVQHLVVDPTNPSNVYAGTAEGVYVSKNGGSSWSGSGLSTSSVTHLAIANGSPNTVYAATSSGLYVTTTGGL